ncbi:MAG: TolC family protein [Acidobacteriota bacterium]|nr:TolC family protein [Acidobacteriota bacterium]
MTFFEALEAAASSPQLQRLAARVEAGEAESRAAEVYPHNPVLELEAADRRGGEGSSTDHMVKLSQQLEIAGQRSARRSTARTDLDAAKAAVSHARRRWLAQTALAFARAEHRRQELEVESTEAELAASFAALVERRLEAGSATALDLALAQAGLARAERRRTLAQSTYRGAQARLAEATAAAAPTVRPAGDLPPLVDPPELAQILDRSRQARGDLRAARLRVNAAEERLQLARKERIPDLTLGVRAGREEGQDLTGVSVAFPLPVIQRNQGAIARGEAELSTARAELAVTELAAGREIATAHGRLTAALEGQQLAQRLGVTPLEKGLELVQRSFDAGKIGAAELLLFRRELVEGRRQLVAARGEAWEAAMELAVAAGVPLPGLEWLESEEAKR